MNTKLSLTKKIALYLMLLPVALNINIFSACAKTLSTTEIAKLIEPIALYPDPLLRQILPAATFPDQIADAALLIRDKADAELIKEQSWDDSVKVIATYPGILKNMYIKLDWTTDLGEAFLNQSEELLRQVQVLRAKAKSYGNLKSTSGQSVKTEKNSNGDTYITIIPSDPEVVYVPQETTTVVYTESVSHTVDPWVPVATFGLGLAIGSAMNDDDDDHYYYGGPWGGGPMWYNNSGYDNWADTRRARNEDMHDEIMDRQDFRQGQRGDRQDFRQDWAKDHPEQVNRENAQKARDNFQSNKGQRQQDYQSANLDRQQKMNSAKSNLQSRSNVNGQFQQRSSTWSGTGGGSFANAASNRGSYSRGSSSISGARSGGGGGFRGGGGGGRRR